MATVYLFTQTLRNMILEAITKLDEIPEEHQVGLIGGFSSDSDNQVNCVMVSSNQQYLTAGTSVVGVYHLKDSLTDQELITFASKTTNKQSGKLLLVGPSSSESQDMLQIREIDMKKQTIDDQQALVKFTDEDVLQEAIIVRVKGQLPLLIPGSESIQQLRKSINGSFNTRGESLKKLNFQLAQSNFSFDGGAGCKDLTISDMYCHIEDEEWLEIEEVNASQNLKRKMKEKLWKKKLAERHPLSLSFNLVEDEGLANETKFTVNLEGKKDVKINLMVDIVLPTFGSVRLKNFHKNLVTYIQRQLAAMKDCVQSFVEHDGPTIHVPKAYHCWPKTKCAMFLSPVYPMALLDSELVEYRRKRHHALLLPTDRPYIRKANRYNFPGDDRSHASSLLINPHIGLGSSGVKSGKISLVDGYYSYHHYMQDGINDNGWGCAYRSLQTIVSWFMHQGYVDCENVPSHKKIQETLVECGDKEPSFIGTSKWIGSQEVSYVLNQLYGITSKIMFVSSGRELSSKGSELRHHFETQGTPIMIGGGVLAHTIIGIDFDEKSGDISFLVLDPHYTGSEDLATVQKKGWCGWKAPNFWDPHSFYNLCLPQRPAGF